MSSSESRSGRMKPEDIRVPGWYYRIEDDRYVRVETHRFPVMKSGFLPTRGYVNESYVERWETGLICEGSTYPPDWGVEFIGPLDRPRPCTCHPDDNPPVPCPQKFALSECRKAALSSEIREPEGYPGIAHDLETMRGVLVQVESYRMDCRCSMKERDSGHHVDCHVPEFQALQDMARNALKNAAPQVAAPVRGNDWRDYPRNAREAGFKE